MGWLEGVLTGYADRHYDIQKQKRLEAETAATREGQVLTTLLQSEYPEIRDYAAAGMLNLANPRRRSGGVAGWMGEIDKSPYLPMIQRARAHIGSDPEYAEAQLGYPPTTPSIPTPAGSVAPPPADAPPGALPSESLTTGGPATAPTPAPTPPPAPPSPMAASFRPGGAPVPGMVASPPVSFAPPQQAQAPQAPPGPAAPPAPAAGAPGMAMQPAPPVADPRAPQTAPPPAPPGQVGLGGPGAATGQVGRVPAPAPRRTQLPGIFPTAADLTRQRERADVLGQVEAWQTLYQQMGDPDWQKKGVEAVLSAKRSALGGQLKEGNARRLPDGSWVQDLYDGYTGKLVSTIPSQGPLAGGTVGTRDSLAFQMYGKQGEDPREVMRRISPFQAAQVDEEMRHRQALQAAEVTLARAEAMADAPLAAQAKSQLIETLNAKWLRLQQPLREMSRQFTTMQTGLKRFQEGDRIGGAQDILVTFQKMLDPISVVRESEYARTASGLSLMGQLEGWWDKLKAGGAGIPVEDMAAMVETSRQLLEGMQGWNDTERGRIEDRANAHGIDPGFIFGGGLSAPVTPPPNKVLPPGGLGGAGATADPNSPKAAAGAVDWNTPLRYDPVTRKMVPAK